MTNAPLTSTGLKGFSYPLRAYITARAAQSAATIAHAFFFRTKQRLCHVLESFDSGGRTQRYAVFTNGFLLILRRCRSTDVCRLKGPHLLIHHKCNVLMNLFKTFLLWFMKGGVCCSIVHWTRTCWFTRRTQTNESLKMPWILFWSPLADSRCYLTNLFKGGTE